MELLGLGKTARKASFAIFDISPACLGASKECHGRVFRSCFKVLSSFGS